MVRNNVVEVSSDYTASTSDAVIICTGDIAKVITIPESGAIGQELIIKDGAGNASDYNISIVCPYNIDGATTFYLTQNWASITLIAKNGVGWYII